MKSNELKKAVSEQGNELGSKNEEATKPENNTLPSNPDMEKPIFENEEIIEEAGKPKAALAPSIQDDEKSKELEKAVKSIFF